MPMICSPIAVLSSDDAHDLFTKTVNPALVQLESQLRSEHWSKAASLLYHVAGKCLNTHSGVFAEYGQVTIVEGMCRSEKANSEPNAEVVRKHKKKNAAGESIANFQNSMMVANIFHESCHAAGQIILAIDASRRCVLRMFLAMELSNGLADK